MPRRRRRATDPRPRLRRAPAALPAAGLGRARPGGDLGERPRRGRAGAARHEAAGAAGDRDHEPARDDGAVGAKNRPTGPQRDRLAGPAHGRPLPRAAGLASARADGARRRSLFLGDQARMAAPARRDRRAARVRHGRLLARLEADRRPRPRHRRDERVPHPARLARHARLGRRAAGALRRPARPAAGDPALERGRRRGRALRRDRAGRGDRRRPAGRPVRRGRDRQGHVRHGELRARAHRRRLLGAARGSRPHRGRSPRLRSCELRARGLGLRHGRGTAMAARRARPDRRRGGERCGGRVSRRERRCLFRARARGARVAALGARCPWADHRADARHPSRAPRPRSARGGRLPDARRARRDARRSSRCYAPTAA